MQQGEPLYSVEKEHTKKMMIVQLILYCFLFTCMVRLAVRGGAINGLYFGFWNKVTDYKTAYLQSLLFLEVMNWYDGIVIDRVWVGHSKFWVLPGTEDIPFVQTWGQVLKKRGLLSAIWIVGAALTAGLVILLF